MEWFEAFVYNIAGISLLELFLYLFAGISAITLLLYVIDKIKAKLGAWRIPERTLLLFSFFGGGIGGAIAFSLVFIVGHVFNLALNLLGSYVHTSRLQYIEYFGRFYEGGGRTFEPLQIKTKYVNVIQEVN